MEAPPSLPLFRPQALHYRDGRVAVSDGATPLQRGVYAALVAAALVLLAGTAWLIWVPADDAGLSLLQWMLRRVTGRFTESAV